MIVAANWKMNPDLATGSRLVMEYAASKYPTITRVLFAPHPYLVPVGVRLQDSGIILGAQDCHAKDDGAHTGDVAAHMLASCGAQMVLLGHSERRSDHHESNAEIQAKARTALAAGLDIMICIGEQESDREQGIAIDVVTAQLVGSLPDDVPAACLTIAYEPVWAIGTGKVAGVDDISEIHDTIRETLVQRGLAGVSILYGGSVKPDNAAAIFAIDNVDGALVGGASLDAEQFASICHAASISAE